MAETGPLSDTGGGRPPAHIPDKLYFRIGEVTGITELPAYVLRFWESEFPEIRPKRTDSGQRLYRKSDIETILFIKGLLYDKKFTIEGARQHLRHLRRTPKQEPSGAKASRGKPDKPTPEKSSTNALLAEIRDELQAIRDLLRD
jgi:DNA-binding transcriptional MerR regulator